MGYKSIMRADESVSEGKCILHKVPFHLKLKIGLLKKFNIKIYVCIYNIYRYSVTNMVLKNGSFFIL